MRQKHNSAQTSLLEEAPEFVRSDGHEAAETVNLIHLESPENRSQTRHSSIEEITSLSIPCENAPKLELYEGDNLQILQRFQQDWRQMVDVVYIDPPYNTGQSHLGYFDRFGSRASDRHSSWRSFMRQRLLIARSMLKSDGAIFISIDDGEVAHLRILCDEIFGEDNFVAQFIWHKTRKGKALSRVARQVTEYVIAYAKDLRVLRPVGLFGMDTISDLPQPLGHRPNKPGTLIFPAGAIEFSLPDGRYEAGLYGDTTDSLSIEVKTAFDILDSVNATPVQLYGRFRWTQPMLTKSVRDGVRFVVRDGKFRITFFRDGGHKAPSSLLDDRCGVGTYEEGTAEVMKLLGEPPPITPKPVSLVRYLLRAVTNGRPDAVVLDFFAGSGTTGHATLDLNASDGGRRRCILITDNSARTFDGYVADGGDQGICRALTARRLQAVLAASDATADFRYYRLS